MPVFLVHGRDHKGKSFRSRFEAPSETDLAMFLSVRSLLTNSIKPMPLSSWPFSRLPFVIMIFPLFAWGVISFGGAVIGGGATYLQEQANHQVYEFLARDGVQVPGRVSGVRQEAQRRGKPITIVEYEYRDPAGLMHRGVLAGKPGNAKKGRHDLSLLPDRELAEGVQLGVTVDPQAPLVHAPFQLDEEFLARHAALLEHRLQRLGLSLAALLACAWLVWNTALRLGSQVEHSTAPRIVEFTSGRSVLAADDDEPTAAEA